MTMLKYHNDLGTPMPRSFSHLLDRFFNETVNNQGNLQSFTPSVDITETETGYELQVIAPGFQKENFQIEMHEGRLTVSGERSFEKKEDGTKYHLLESQYGSFKRSFQLPDNVKQTDIQAQYENGILKLTLPKDEQKVMKHRIEVK